MTELSNMRWKYLRETTKKYYDPSRNTSLDQYLSYIFSDANFIYDSCIPKDIILSRNSNASYRRFRPDARCEELNLIVEFDGLAHYQDPQVVLQDIDKDAYLRSLGYIVVRIPYWIQLSIEVIQVLFHDYTHLITLKSEMCSIACSFHDIDKDTLNLSSSVGAMCELGRYRFLDEVVQFPLSIQHNVYDDIMWCCNYAEDNLSMSSNMIMPDYLLDKWVEMNPEANMFIQ